jgi:cytidine deaminase
MNIFRSGNLSDSDIMHWLTDIRCHAFVPESAFAVACVLRAGAGSAEDYYFAGVNVENAEHRLSTHGEEGAIAAMVTALGPGARIKEGWVIGARQDATPGNAGLAACCGKCRQQIAGFSAPETKIHTVDLRGQTATTTVGSFLPDAFSFGDYLPEAALKRPKGTAPVAGEVEKKLIRKSPLEESEVGAWLKSLESVACASGKHQSVILQLNNGFYAGGVKIEDAAFTGMSAMQSALAIAIGEFGKTIVKRAWISGDGPTLAALQTLLPLAESPDMPVIFADDGKKATLRETALACLANVA